MEYNYKNTNCIVAGGAGFIGQNLVNKLIEDGAEVYVIDNFSYGALKSNINKKAHIIENDIRDPGVFEKLPKQQYNYLFYFASPSSVVLFKQNPNECLDITIGGFINCINYCAKNKIKLIYPSSGKVYMGAELPSAENTQLHWNALDTYAKSKLILENIASAYEKICDSLGVRIFAGFGPSEKHKGEHASAIYLFCKEIIGGKIPVIWGDGTQTRDFVYIDDLARAILILAQNSKESIVNIGSGELISFNKVIEIINSILKTNIISEYIEKPKFYVEETLADTSIFKKYCPQLQYSFEDGIREVIKSLNLPSKDLQELK